MVDYLKKMSFKNSSPFYKTAQGKLLSYFENTWLYGSYPPAMWNLFNKTSQLTNNPQEGYNSKLNKLVQSPHPNPNVLLNHLTNLLTDAELKTSKTLVRSSQYYINHIHIFASQAGIVEKPRVTDVHFLKKIGTVSVSHGGNFLKTKDSSTPPFPAPVSLQDDELDAIK